MPDNLHSVWMHSALLGIHCKGCGHRAVLNNKRFPEIRRSNMTPLRSLKLRCAKCNASVRPDAVGHVSACRRR